MVLDMVGGDYVQRDIDIMAPDGRRVSIAFLGGPKVTLNLTKVMVNRLTLTGSTLRPRPVAEKGKIAQALRERVWPLLESGKIKPLIFKTFPLAEAAAAHALMETSSHIGKIVLTLDCLNGRHSAARSISGSHQHTNLLAGAGKPHISPYKGRTCAMARPPESFRRTDAPAIDAESDRRLAGREYRPHLRTDRSLLRPALAGDQGDRRRRSGGRHGRPRPDRQRSAFQGRDRARREGRERPSAAC